MLDFDSHGVLFRTIYHPLNDYRQLKALVLNGTESAFLILSENFSELQWSQNA